MYFRRKRCLHNRYVDIHIRIRDLNRNAKSFLNYYGALIVYNKSNMQQIDKIQFQIISRFVSFPKQFHDSLQQYVAKRNRHIGVLMLQHAHWSNLCARVTQGWREHLYRHPIGLSNLAFQNQNEEWLKERRTKHARGSQGVFSGRTKSRSKAGQPIRYNQPAFSKVSCANNDRDKQLLMSRSDWLYYHVMKSK